MQNQGAELQLSVWQQVVVIPFTTPGMQFAAHPNTVAVLPVKIVPDKV